VEVGRLAASVPSDNTQIKDHVDKIKSVAETTVQTVRNIALLLRPSMLDDLGLIAALEWQGREVSRRSEMEVEIQSGNGAEKIPDEYSICIYRLVQEALNNAARHSSAKNARVTVEQTANKFWSVFLTTAADSTRKGFAALAFWEWKSGAAPGRNVHH